MSREVLKAMSSAGEAVVGIAVLAALGAWGGTWLDSHFRTTPWFALCLSLGGTFAGLARMVMKALQADKEETTQPLPFSSTTYLGNKDKRQEDQP